MTGGELRDTQCRPTESTQLMCSHMKLTYLSISASRLQLRRGISLTSMHLQTINEAGNVSVCRTLEKISAT